jgi:uroporphyrin-III C-methyltransferase/precorrin-2 dehydrogenase/sirohydrochlorin ferrochelatase
MESLPLFHRLAGRPVLVLGAGEAADAKRRLVADAGGRPVADLEPAVRLAFVALDDGAEAEAVAGSLRARGLLVNVVDRPELCDFTVPAIVDRAPVTVAIGTGGASASLAKALKERLELILPAGLGALAGAIRAARDGVARRHTSVAARRAFWAGLLAPGGPLDPLTDIADPAAAIEAGPGVAANPSAVTLDLAAPDGDPARFDVETLTLKDLRALAAADLVLLPPSAPAALLAFVRRDAARRAGDALPADVRGRIVCIRFRAG